MWGAHGTSVLNHLVGAAFIQCASRCVHYLLAGLGHRRPLIAVITCQKLLVLLFHEFELGGLLLFQHFGFDNRVV